MDCKRAASLIDAYTTNELDLAASLDLEEHLERCAACGEALESVHALRRTLGGSSLRYAAPPDLRRRIFAELGPVAALQEPAPRRHVRRFALAAAVAALLLLPWAGLYWNASRSSAGRLAADVTSSHIRSLMDDHLLDVVSTDRHTVKPWFSGRLDFSPAVVDLTADGFPLVGGRLDYVANHPVAAIVYRRNKHVINLYTWPSSLKDSPPSASQHNGYQLLSWTCDGMNCVAVSDLNPQELRQFAELLGARLTVRR